MSFRCSKRRFYSASFLKPQLRRLTLEPWFFPANFHQKAKALPLKASEGVTMEPLDPAKNRDFRDGSVGLPKTEGYTWPGKIWVEGKWRLKTNDFYGETMGIWWDMVRCRTNNMHSNPLIEKGSKFYLFGCSFFGPFLFW